MFKLNYLSLKPIGITLLLSSLLVGCSSIELLHLKSNYVAATQDQNHPEIIATEAYKVMPKKVISVAIKAPDQCISYTTDQRTGSAQANETILKTDCGLEMGEIERALAKAGYRVISWTAFNQQIDKETNIINAAANLGAEVIFQINSLENSIKNLGQDARWERSYFTSNYQGQPIAPLQLNAAERNLLAHYFLANLENKYNARTYAVTLDAAAIQVSNGQTIWYYRWTKASTPNLQENNISVNLQCVDAITPYSCRVFTPYNPNNQRTLDLASGDTIGISQSEKPEDIAKAQYSTLYREVVSNLVDSFVNSKTY